MTDQYPGVPTGAEQPRQEPEPTAADAPTAPAAGGSAAGDGQPTWGAAPAGWQGDTAQGGWAGQPGQTGWQTPAGSAYPGTAQPGPAAGAWQAQGAGQPAADPWAGYGAAGYSEQSGYGASYPQGGTYGSTGQSGYPTTGYGSTGYADQSGYGTAWQHDTTVYGATSPTTAPAPPAPPAKKTGTSRVGWLLAAAALTGLLAGALGGYAGAQLGDGGSSTGTVALPQSDAQLSDRPEGSIAAIAARVSPSVVSIEVSGNGGAGTGSGFVVRSNGYIVTNNHVVEAAAGGGTITVVFSDGTKLDGTIVGRDPNYDLAVVKVEASDLPAVTLGNSDSVVVGDGVIAIGSPLGLEGTVTAGIVSALNRPVTAGDPTGGDTSFINAIQTDAAINPGNSGGPLVNAAGEVIGVNSAIASLGAGTGQAGSIGLGFAIPVNQAQRIAEELINTGTSTKPIIGVRLDTQYTGAGARVESVDAGGPAADAGMQGGDVIVEFNGKPVEDSTQLIVDIRAMQPGDKVTMQVQRGGGTEELTVTLGSDSSSN